MKIMWKSLLLLFILGLGTNVLQAQKEDDEMMTESSEVDEDIYVDDVVQKRLIFEQRVLPYESVREADISWEKRMWRILDVREKMNLPFINPNRPFFNILLEAVENGDLLAFKGNSDNFKESLTKDDLDKIIFRIDTTVVFDPETYEEEIKVVRSVINYEDIKRYRIKEIWFFDEESSTMKCRILGIAPIKDELDDNGNFKYSLPLFWIYYPEAREVLAKERVFNPYNDAAPMSWSDLFEARFFSSYIFKVSNPLDLRLKDQYGEGVDMLLESEKVKRELFNFEHDLWTY